MENGLNKNAVTNRLGLSVIGELRRLVCILELSLDNEYIKKYLNLICSEYKNFINNGIWPNENTNLNIKDDMLQIINEPNEFVKKQRAVLREQNRPRQSFYESIVTVGGKEVVIFGAGAYGKSCCMDLFDGGFDIIAFCDNNQTLWGDSLYGIKIISPNDLKNIKNKKDICFIIANKTHASEIEEQLVNIGINRVHIVRYNK